MAYLAHAMNDVLARTRAKRETETRRREQSDREAAEQKRRTEEDAKNRIELELRERAFAQFVAAQPTRSESEIVAEICRRSEFPMTTGQIGRMFAIGAWWDAQTTKNQAGYAQEVG